MGPRPQWGPSRRWPGYRRPRLEPCERLSPWTSPNLSPNPSLPWQTPVGGFHSALGRSDAVFAVDHFLPVPPFKLRFGNPFLPCFLPSACWCLRVAPLLVPPQQGAAGDSRSVRPRVASPLPLGCPRTAALGAGSAGETHRGCTPPAPSAPSAAGRAGSSGAVCPSRSGPHVFGCGAGEVQMPIGVLWLDVRPASGTGTGAVLEPGLAQDMPCPYPVGNGGLGIPSQCHHWWHQPC